jgi:hypothetical protein
MPLTSHAEIDCSLDQESQLDLTYVGGGNFKSAVIVDPVFQLDRFTGHLVLPGCSRHKACTDKRGCLAGYLGTGNVEARCGTAPKCS